MPSFKKGGGFNEVEDGGFLSIDDKKSPPRQVGEPLSVKGHRNIYHIISSMKTPTKITI
jgi:hypothetical protein